MGADQFSNADQIARTGAGVVVSPDARTPQTIRAAITEVLDNPSYAAGARVVQADIAGHAIGKRRVDKGRCPRRWAA